MTGGDASIAAASMMMCGGNGASQDTLALLRAGLGLALHSMPSLNETNVNDAQSVPAYTSTPTVTPGLPGPSFFPPSNCRMTLPTQSAGMYYLEWISASL